MIYGLYLSASGVLTSLHKQDVIANNLANVETIGFKRSMALFKQRRTEAQEQGKSPEIAESNPLLENIGGGLLAQPTYIDQSQGTLEMTGNNLDTAIHGKGFFAVKDGNETRLTRNGRFMVDRAGSLILADGSNHKVLDTNGNPITLVGVPQSLVNIGPDGTISSDRQQFGRLGLFDVPDPSQLKQRGNTLLQFEGDFKKLAQASGTVLSGHIENSNVDPTTELTQLISVQRQLEANANMIRFQDQTLGRLVNDVAKAV